MAALTEFALAPSPGIQRDSTKYRRALWTDGQWTRFYNDRPQKIGGYTVLDYGNSEIVRNLFSVNAEKSIFLYIGRPSSLSICTTNESLATSPEVDITPVGFVADTNNTWSFCTISYGAVPVNYIIAVARPNGDDISNTTEGQIYYGVVGDTVPLQPLQQLTPDVEILTTAGGVVSVGNYLMFYGNNGIVFWNDGLSLTNWPSGNHATFETSQIVYAAPVKSGQALSALFWSLDFVGQLSLQQTNAEDPATYTFVPGYTSTQSTLLSASSIVSLDPYFYWIGNNSFYWFNGSVIELPNTVNKEYFFSNMNRSSKEKITGFVNRLYNEIWWLYPFGEATENTNAIMTGANTGYWFDTANIARSTAISSNTQFPYPLMASSIPLVNGSTQIYPIWAHEYGWDQIALGQSTTITSFVESNLMHPASTLNDPTYTNTIVDTLIPDIEQTGDMYCYFNLRAYPNSPATQSDFFTITETTEFLTVRQKASIFSFVLGSSTLGGTYLLGDTKFLIKPAGDERPGPAQT